MNKINLYLIVIMIVIIITNIFTPVVEGYSPAPISSAPISPAPISPAQLITVGTPQIVSGSPQKDEIGKSMADYTRNTKTQTISGLIAGW